MKTTRPRFLILTGIFCLSMAVLSSCTSQAHCPGVAGTGNSATHKGGGGRKTHCPGTASTGNFKPKVSNKKQDGLYSKKMARSMKNAPAATPASETTTEK
jgi:hypothetical protein